MKRIIHFITVLIFFAASSAKAHAQAEVDIASLPAYNDDANRIKSLLTTRASIEVANSGLHELAKAANLNYKDINVELDKYSRYFDILDGLLATVNTYIDGRSTYNTIQARIADYQIILQDYETKCLARGDIQSTDAQIIEINRRAIQKITAEVGNIVSDIKNLSIFAISSAYAISAADYAWLINRIDSSLIRIRDLVNQAYVDTWQYIVVRTNLWKKEIYLARDKKQMASDALGRWLNAIDQVNEGIYIKTKK